MVTFKDDLDQTTGVVQYTYDMYGKRIRRQADLDYDTVFEQDEKFVYDGNNLALVYENGSLTNRYLYADAIDSALAEDDINSGGYATGTDWLLGDHQGTIRDVVNELGVEETHLNYDAFGNVLDITGTDPTAPRFTYVGQEFDEATGQYYYWHRWYDAATGRWTSVDPIGYAAGDVNLYRYVGNSPVIYIDPTGLAAANAVKNFGSWMSQSLGNLYQSASNLASTASKWASSTWSTVTSNAYAADVARGDQIVKQHLAARKADAPSLTTTQSLVSGFKEGLGGGASILTNEFTFGASDYVGLTNSESYQGWQYDASRISSAVAVESALFAASGGTSSLARYTTRAVDAVDYAKSAYELYGEVQANVNGQPANWANVFANAAGVGGPGLNKAGDLLGVLKPAAKVDVPVRPGQTGTYGELKAQKRGYGETEPLDMDHQPSFAAQVAAKEAELGRKLKPHESASLRANTPAVASPREVHQQSSPTYGGRNTPSQIAQDAADLNAAAARDRSIFEEAMKKNR